MMIARRRARRKPVVLEYSAPIPEDGALDRDERDRIILIADSGKVYVLVMDEVGDIEWVVREPQQ